MELVQELSSLRHLGMVVPLAALRKLLIREALDQGRRQHSQSSVCITLYPAQDMQRHTFEAA